MIKKLDYQFTSNGLKSDESLAVVDFTGFESISKPYEYHINLKSETVNIDMEAMLSNDCSFIMEVDGEKKIVHGVLSQFDQLRQVDKYTFYSAVLVPKLWQASLYHMNEVYLNMDIKQIIEAVLEETGIQSSDYEINFLESYPKWEYRCQFKETHLQFISRLMEYLGIYYYFEQGENSEKIIFTDNLQYQKSISNPEIKYTAITGLDKNNAWNNIYSFICRQTRLPQNLMLRDYNYENPALDVEGKATIDDKGTGEVFIYGENFNTPEEGEQLAKVRAEELICDKKKFYGESSVNRMSIGYFFNLDNHFNETVNQKYLVTEIEHEGKKPGHLADNNQISDYKNSFTAISAKTQFRSKQFTPKPRFYGTIHAMIDSEADGKYAELDDMGRYKVVLPFDRSNPNGGKASHWVRMSQPFAGANEGMQFPLRKGTEVLLSFYNGDPDQPVICGALPNTDNPSIRTGDSQTRNTIKTSSGNMIDMEDKEGKSRIKFYSPKSDTYMHLGASNHPGNGMVFLTKGIHRLEAAGGEQVTLIAKDFKTPAYQEEKKPDKEGWTVESEIAKKFIDEQEIFTFPEGKDTGIKKVSNAAITQENEEAGKYIIERKLGDKYFYSEGNEYYFGGGDVFEFGDGFSVATICDETQGYTVDTTAKDQMETIANTIPDIKADFQTQDDAGCAGRLFVEHIDGPTVAWASDRSHNFNFGGGSEYNFGGGWVETFIGSDGTTAPDKLNKVFSNRDLAAPGCESISSDGIDLGSDFDVDKTIGNTYEYAHGKSIEVAYQCDTLSKSYGGETKEIGYKDDGTKVSESWSKGTESYEKTYDHGNPVAHNAESNQGAGIATFAAAFVSSIGMETNFDITQETSIKVGMTSEINIFGGLRSSIDISASLFLDITLTAGIGIEIEETIGGKLYKKEDGSTGWRSIGLKTEKAAELEAKKETLALAVAAMKLEKKDLNLLASSLDMTNSKLALKNGLNINL